MPSSTTINALDAQGRGLRAVFERTGDQFAQRVETNVRGVWATLLCSSPHDSGSHTPGLQEAHQQEVEGTGPVVFLTGAASGDFWSASVHRCGGSASGVVFDVSCRRSKGATPVAVRFAAPGATPLHRAPELLRAETDGVRWSLAVEESSPRAYLTAWESPTMACDPDADDDEPSVLRWRFIVRIE